MSRKYLKDGRAVMVQQQVEGGFLVCNLLRASSFEEGDNDEEFADDRVYLVAEVFDSAPTAVLDSKVAELNEQVAKLQGDLTMLRAKAHEQKELDRQRMGRITQINKLELLDDYIQGKITHYAILEHWGGPSILDAADAVTEDSRWDKKLRLLSLFGDSKGDLTWGLSRYSSMSHDNLIVMPARSREEAEGFVRANLTQKMAAANLSQPHVYENLLKQARHFGADIPAALSEAFEKYKETARRLEIGELRMKIADSTAKLTALGETA